MLMKKKYLSLVFCFIIAFCLSGCIRMDQTITVNKDKTFDYSLLYAMSDEAMSSMSQDSDEKKEMFPDEALDEFKKKGWGAVRYSEDGYTGAEFSKKNIKFEDAGTFYADFSDLNMDLGNETGFEFTEKDGVYTFRMESDPSEAQTYLSYINSMNGSLKLVVNLPSKAIKHNATSTSNGGKTLTWDLTKLTEKTELYAEFKMSAGFPWKWILIGLGILLLVIVLIVIISKLTGKKKENADPFGGYDYSGVAGGAMDAVGEGVEGAKDFIGDKVDDVKDFAGDKIDDAKEFVEDKIEDAPDAVKQGYEQVKGAVEDGVEAAKDAVGDGIDQAKDAAEDGIDDLRSRFDN